MIVLYQKIVKKFVRKKAKDRFYVEVVFGDIDTTVFYDTQIYYIRNLK